MVKIAQNCTKLLKTAQNWSNLFLFFADWPQLPPLPSETEEETLSDHISDSSIKNRNPSGPKAQDPYENEEGSAMLPIFVAIGAFIPLVFCMCKL